MFSARSHRLAAIVEASGKTVIAAQRRQSRHAGAKLPQETDAGVTGMGGG